MKRLLLLPGMDGTGELFAPFAAAVSPWARVQLARYPPRTRATIDELVAALALDAPVTLVAESFSSAVAIRFAARHPALVERVVLAGAFATAPPASRLLRLAGRVPFLLGPPKFVVRTFLTGAASSDALVEQVQLALSRVAAPVLSDRLAQLSRLDERATLRSLAMPVLTLSARRDRLISRDVTAQLRDACPPGARHVELDGPHLLLQACAEEAARHVRAFVGA